MYTMDNPGRRNAKRCTNVDGRSAQWNPYSSLPIVGATQAILQVSAQGPPTVVHSQVSEDNIYYVFELDSWHAIMKSNKEVTGKPHLDEASDSEHHDPSSPSKT